MSKPECKCSMRIKLVGDGCAVCNPEYWRNQLEMQKREAAAERRARRNAKNGRG